MSARHRSTSVAASTFTLSVLFSGGTVIMRAPPFEPTDLASAVQTHEANALFLVPTQLRRLLRAAPEIRSASSASDF